MRSAVQIRPAAPVKHLKSSDFGCFLLLFVTFLCGSYIRGEASKAKTGHSAKQSAKTLLTLTFQAVGAQGIQLYYLLQIPCNSAGNGAIDSVYCGGGDSVAITASVYIVLQCHSGGSMPCSCLGVFNILRLIVDIS